MDQTIEPTDIKIVQYMYGDFEYFTWSERINGQYVRRHGYQHVISRQTPRSDRHVTWEKIPIILDELHDCEYLLWVDADAIFYSQELKIEQELIPMMDGYSILFTPDIFCEAKRWNENLPCSGVILMKNDSFAREFMTSWNQASDIDEESRWKWPPEQLALWRVVLPKYGVKIKLLKEYYMMNGIFGQFIRHFPLKKDGERVEAMRELCRLRNWEVERDHR